MKKNNVLVISSLLMISLTGCSITPSNLTGSKDVNLSKSSYLIGGWNNTNKLTTSIRKVNGVEVRGSVLVNEGPISADVSYYEIVPGGSPVSKVIKGVKLDAKAGKCYSIKLSEKPIYDKRFIIPGYRITGSNGYVIKESPSSYHIKGYGKSAQFYELSKADCSRAKSRL